MQQKTMQMLAELAKAAHKMMGGNEDDSIEFTVCLPKNICPICCELYPAESEAAPCPNCNPNNAERIDDGSDYPPAECAHDWIAENKCAWCSIAIAPKPRERIKYDSSFDDDINYDDINCPKCATHTQSRECTSLGCDDGYHDDYEDDPLWFDEGDYSRCGECHGTGIERWCPACGWEWRGEKLS